MRLSPLLIGLALLPLVGCSSVSYEKYNPPIQTLTSNFETKSGYKGTVTVHFKNESTRLKHYIPEEDVAGLNEEDYIAETAPRAVLGYVDIKWTSPKDFKSGNESAGQGPFYQRLMLVAIPYFRENDYIEFVGMGTYDVGSYWKLEGNKRVSAGLNNFLPVKSLRGCYRKNGDHEGVLTFKDYNPDDVLEESAKAPMIEVKLNFEVGT